MGNARWATSSEIKNRLEEIVVGKEIKTSGIPIGYNGKSLLIDDKEAHNMIIGSTGSGKTQSTILPMIRLSIQAKESLVVIDPKGELYEKCANKAKEEGYKVVLLDFDTSKYGNSWNPLDYIYKNYKENNHDLSIKLLEDLGYYLFIDENENNSDPFWINTTIDYFTGLVLYLFENAKEEEINLQSIYNLSNYLNIKGNSEKFIEKLDKSKEVYLNVSGTLCAPPETRGSILSVFSQKIKRYISRTDLINMICNNEFKIEDFYKEKTIIFIKCGITGVSHRLIPLLITQLIECANLRRNKERINFLLDEFDSMLPIKDFAGVIQNCRSLNIRFTVTIQSYEHLKYMYNDNVNILKYCFANIIYLLSEDLPTLEDISRYCGESNNKPLISVEELKSLDYFESIIMMIRMMPIKTKLLPDYKINWGYEDKIIELPKRKEKEIKLYVEKK